MYTDEEEYLKRENEDQVKFKRIVAEIWNLKATAGNVSVYVNPIVRFGNVGETIKTSDTPNKNRWEPRDDKSR